MIDCPTNKWSGWIFLFEMASNVKYAMSRERIQRDYVIWTNKFHFYLYYISSKNRIKIFFKNFIFYLKAINIIIQIKKKNLNFLFIDQFLTKKKAK